MERIKLSKAEKKVMLLVAAKLTRRQTAVKSDEYILSIHSLHDKGLVRGAFVEGGDVEAVRLTDKGRLYLYENPNLSNPTDWSKISAIAGIIAAVAAIAALFVACSFHALL